MHIFIQIRATNILTDAIHHRDNILNTALTAEPQLFLSYFIFNRYVSINSRDMFWSLTAVLRAIL